MAGELIINDVMDGSAVTLKVSGRIDTNTAPSLESKIQEVVTESIKKLVIDLEDVNYVSSAGLRVFLSAHKMMSKLDGLEIAHANDDIKEIFEVTGFSDILTIV